MGGGGWGDEQSQKNRRCSLQLSLAVPHLECPATSQPLGPAAAPLRTFLCSIAGSSSSSSL